MHAPPACVGSCSVLVVALFLREPCFYRSVRVYPECRVCARGFDAMLLVMERAALNRLLVMRQCVCLASVRVLHPLLSLFFYSIVLSLQRLRCL